MLVSSVVSAVSAVSVVLRLVHVGLVHWTNVRLDVFVLFFIILEIDKDTFLPHMVAAADSDTKAESSACAHVPRCERERNQCQ